MPRNVEVYDKAQVETRLAEHADWTLGEDNMLHADYTLKNFQQAMMFANAIAHQAETLDHHPDIFIHQWNHVSISTATHSENAITSLDFELISRIDGLPRFPQ